MPRQIKFSGESDGWPSQHEISASQGDKARQPDHAVSHTVAVDILLNLGVPGHLLATQLPGNQPESCRADEDERIIGAGGVAAGVDVMQVDQIGALREIGDLIGGGHSRSRVGDGREHEHVAVHPAGRTWHQRTVRATCQTRLW